MSVFEKVVIVRRETELEALVSRFNTQAQAKFYLEHSGRPFEPYESFHDTYHQVLSKVRHAIPRTLKTQVIERELVPQFSFSDDDLIVVVGQDGVVANTAKYAQGRPILAINPDPERIDGALLYFDEATFAESLSATLSGESTIKRVSMAQARLNDGQTLLAFNDLFIGARTHVSARYEIAVGRRKETQSSSGVIVSTGAGSSGWLQSIYAGAAGIIEALGGEVITPPQGGRMAWDTSQLIYSVREPFPSPVTGTSYVHGTFSNESPLTITSLMPSGGTVFSDGIEADYLEFNAGAELTVTIAPTRAALVTPSRVNEP